MGPVSGKRLRLRDKMRNRLRDSHARLPRARVDLADLHYGGKARDVLINARTANGGTPVTVDMPPLTCSTM